MNFKKYQSFFKDKKILLTGGSGFIGANAASVICEFAKETNLIVRKGSSLYRLKDYIHKVKLHYISLDNQDELLAYFKQGSMDIIFHFAQPSIYNVNNTFDYLKSQSHSLKMLANILALAKEQNVLKVIHACSSTIYGDTLLNDEGAFKEGFDKKPSSLRGLIKLSERNYCQYYAKKFNFPVYLGRIFRAYGPNDAENKLIDKSLINYKIKKPVQLISHSIKRDYIYIDDVINCLLAMCITNMKQGEEINIGSGKESSASEIIEMLNTILSSKILVSSDSHPTSDMDQTHWKADISKAKNLLNWEPQTSLYDGLEKCVAYHNLK